MKRKLTKTELLKLREKLVDFSLTLVKDKKKFETFKSKPTAISDWSKLMAEFGKFGIGESLGGLSAGSPILIQAIQREIQTAVDAGTALAKAKEGLQKKIGQILQEGAE